MTTKTRPYRHRYGLTLEEYELQLGWQGGRCAICQRKPGTRRLSWDHDHVTGLIRGLLCDYCNRRVVGRHRVDKMIAAAEYLKNPPAVLTLGKRYVPKTKKKRRTK